MSLIILVGVLGDSGVWEYIAECIRLECILEMETETISKSALKELSDSHFEFSFSMYGKRLLPPSIFETSCPFVIINKSLAMAT